MSALLTPFRFYDNRQKYLAFVNTCNEKSAVARRAAHELGLIQPTPPAIRLFDAGMGDATVLVRLMRSVHRHFPTVPMLVVAKEISLEDVRLGLEKLPDSLFEHPGTVFVITNLNYADAPRLTARDLEAEKAKQSSRTGAATPSTGPREMAPSDEARARALRRLAQRAMTFFGLSMFFFFIGHETGADWWIWPVFGMGISLVIRASRVFFGDAAEKEERQAEKRLSRRERRRMQRAERLADFERKVSIGADALVRVIEEAKGMKTRLEADLNPPRREASQAPREKQQDGPRVLVTPPPVRVETSEARERDEIEREGERGGGERERTRRA